MAEIELGNILNKRLCFGEEQEDQEEATRRKIEEDQERGLDICSKSLVRSRTMIKWSNANNPD